jgi:hypothetical protein
LPHPVTKALRDFEAVHSGHANIEQDHFRAVAFDRAQRRRAVVHDLDLVPQLPDQRSEHGRRIDVVVHHQNATCPAGRPAMGRPLRLLWDARCA